jgi:hypothetical protein
LVGCCVRKVKKCTPKACGVNFSGKGKFLENESSCAPDERSYGLGRFGSQRRGDGKVRQAWVKIRLGTWGQCNLQERSTEVDCGLIKKPNKGLLEDVIAERKIGI